MNRKVRDKGEIKKKYITFRPYQYDSPIKMRVYLKRLENESIGALIMKSNSIKSEGKLAKEINFSDD